MKLDLHVHSCYSADALTKPETIVKVAKKKDLAVAITDHNNFKVWPILEKLAKELNVIVIPGQEIEVWDTGQYMGELTVYFLQEAIRQNNLWSVVDEVRKQNALLCVPHPFDKLRSSRFRDLEKVVKKLDLIETFNSRTHLGIYNKKAEKFAEENSIPKIAGSDAHTPEEIGNAYLEVRAASLETARKELIKGKGKIVGRKATVWDHVQSQLARRNMINYR